MSSAVRVAPLAHGDEERVADVARIIVDCFSQDKDTHSWGRALGRPKEGLGYYMQEYVPKQAQQSVPGNLISLAASPAGDGAEATAGALLMEDLCPDPGDKAEPPPPTPGMAEIEALLGACEAVFWDGCRTRGIAQESVKGRGVVSYFAWLAVGEGQRRKGAARALVQKGAERSRECGFLYGLAYCTSPKSTKVFGQAGFECWGAISYRGFEFGGGFPYASLEDEVSVMVKRL